MQKYWTKLKVQMLKISCDIDVVLVALIYKLYIFYKKVKISKNVNGCIFLSFISVFLSLLYKGFYA